MAKDQHDAKTQSFSFDDAAQRQAKYKFKKNRMGYKRKQVWVQDADFQAGQDFFNSHGLAVDSILRMLPDDVDAKSFLVGLASQFK